MNLKNDLFFLKKFLYEKLKFSNFFNIKNCMDYIYSFES